MRWFLVVLTIVVASTLSMSEARSAEPSAATSDSKPTTESKPVLSGSELAAAVRVMLRDTTHRQTPDDATVRKLVGYHQALVSDTNLPAGERKQLRLAVLGRLKQWQKVLAQQALPGQPGALQNGFQPMPVDHGQELLELIQETIAPDSWDVRGGPGVIRYWGGGHAMVIRQTGEVHGTLAQLLVDLR